MSNQLKTHHPCPECGAPMVYETRPDTLEYHGHERTFEMLAWWCTKCDEAVFEGQPLADRETAFLEFKAEVDEVLSPAQVAAVRAKLGLSQRKASELLGGGPRSFYKYESGKQAVSVPMSHLLRLLDKDVSRLEELPGAVTRVKDGLIVERPDPCMPGYTKVSVTDARNPKAGLYVKGPPPRTVVREALPGPASPRPSPARSRRSRSAQTAKGS